MALAQSDILGGNHDEVSLELGGKQVLYSENYQVAIGVLTQPAAFSLNCGYKGIAGELKKQYPARIPFLLRVNGRVQQTGLTDGTVMQGGQGTTISFRGRDMLAGLARNDVDSEKSYADATMSELVEDALKASGIAYDVIAVDNALARQTRTGTTPLVFSEPNYNPKATKRLARAHIGESWAAFLKRHLDHAGLFLFAAPSESASASGLASFIVTRPNPNQRPLYRIIRSAARGDINNVELNTFRDETTHRYAHIKVFAKGGGRGSGRQHFQGSFDDQEMLALGYTNTKSYRDVECDDDAECEFYARRKVAELARGGFQLQYTVAGHSAPRIGGGTAVWSPDTLVSVKDEDAGLDDDFYIENVVFNRAPTTTQITLLRPLHLVFGAD